MVTPFLLTLATALVIYSLSSARGNAASRPVHPPEGYLFGEPHFGDPEPPAWAREPAATSREAVDGR